MKASRTTLFLALFPFACGYLLSYLLRAVNAVVAPDLVREFALGPADLGLLTSAYLLAFCAFQLPLGVLLDRFGTRRVQSCLLVLASIGCMGFALAPNLAGLIGARAVIGLGFSAGLMASYKSSAVWVPVERRSLANAAIMAMGALGIVFATVPTALLSQAIGWRGMFLVFAACTFCVAGLIFLAVPEKPDGARVPSLTAQWKELIEIFRLPLFWRVAPLLGLSAGIPIAYQTLWAGPWFRDVAQLPPPDVALGLFWMAVAFMAGILSIGIVADRLQRVGVGPMQTFLGFLVLHMAAQAVLVLQLPDLGFAAWLVLAAVGQVAILAFPWFAGKVGEHRAGRANATLNFCMFVAAFAAQYGVGLVIGLFPPSATGYDAKAYALAFAICLLLQFIALVWYLWPRKELGREPA